MTKNAQQVIASNIHTLVSISASDKSKLPERVEILQVGMWDSPTHGMFMVTREDLLQYIDNFNNDVRAHSSTEGLPVDYGHEREKEAAFWMTRLFLAPSSKNPQEESLWSDVSWTDEGARQVVEGRWKFFSPEFVPRGRGGYVDPEGVLFDIENVLLGGGLTNRPLFKGLSPVAASEGGSTEGQKMLYISASDKEQKMPLVLDDVRKKERADLTEEERQLLADKKAELTAEELTKFDLGEAPKEDPKPEPSKDPATPPVQASEGNGMVSISAADLQRFKDTDQAYRKEKATQVVEAHVKRGAIKSDQAEQWTNTLLASEGETRKNMETMLANLPDNQLLADELGSNTGAGHASSAIDELHKRATEIVSASEKAGTKVSLAEAYRTVQDSDTDLRDRVNKERANN